MIKSKILFLGAITCFTSAQVVQHEAEGNLKSNKPLGCVSLSQVANTKTPADIFVGVSSCIEEANYNAAAQLYILANLFGKFDTLRVKDVTAHQAISVLKMEAFASLSEETLKYLTEAIKQYLKDDVMAELCGTVAKLGPPIYDPDYMLQHGIRAFTGEAGNGLREDFDPQQAWAGVLDQYLHCPKIGEKEEK